MGIIKKPARKWTPCGLRCTIQSVSKERRQPEASISTLLPAVIFPQRLHWPTPHVPGYITKREPLLKLCDPEFKQVLYVRLMDWLTSRTVPDKRESETINRVPTGPRTYTGHKDTYEKKISYPQANRSYPQ